MKSVKAQTTIVYHGRSGKPRIHYCERGKPYIMVRKKGGGTKRLYLQAKKARQAISQGYKALRKEALRRRK